MSNIDFLPITSSVVSTDTGSAVRFTVTNNSDEHLTLYWVDRAGIRQAYNGLDKGQSLAQDTVSSHAWELTSADGKVAFRFFPTSPGSITVGANYQPSSPTSRKRLPRPNTACGHRLRVTD